MLPSAWLFLETWPLTPSGKLDRKNLPAPPQDLLLSQEETFVAPQTSTQQFLAAIWASLLGISQVGIHDNFFALGGHSLLATQVIARIYDACQIELPLRTLFKQPTIAELALTIDQAQAALVELADDEELAEMLMMLEA